MKKLKTIFIYTAILLTAHSTLSTAQGPGFDGDVDDVPVDGGVTLIAAAAAGYGFKKLRDRRKSE